MIFEINKSGDKHGRKHFIFENLSLSHQRLALKYFFEIKDIDFISVEWSMPSTKALIDLNITSFATVRDPYERLLSCFKFDNSFPGRLQTPLMSDYLKGRGSSECNQITRKMCASEEPKVNYKKLSDTSKIDIAEKALNRLDYIWNISSANFNLHQKLKSLTQVDTNQVNKNTHRDRVKNHSGDGICFPYNELVFDLTKEEIYELCSIDYELLNHLSKSQESQ